MPTGGAAFITMGGVARIREKVRLRRVGLQFAAGCDKRQAGGPTYPDNGRTSENGRAGMAPGFLIRPLSDGEPD